MRGGWDLKKLGEVATVSSGNSAPQKKELFEEGIFPFIRTSDVGKIRKGFISSCVDYLNNDGIKGLKLFSKGTILFPKSGASTFLNHRVMMEIDGYVSSHLATIKANNKIVDDRFLLYFLTTIDARDLMQDIAYPSLKTSEISLIQIPLPPLAEQQRIVAILDEAFAAIDKAKANAEKNLRNAKELFESYLQGVFENKGDGWEEKTLGEVCSLITDGKHGDCENEAGSGYYFLSAKDVRNGTLLFENARQITKSGFEETHRRTNLKPGDICMVNTGATIGRISFAPDDPRTYHSTFQKSVAVIKTIPDLMNNYYCCYLLQSDVKKLVKVSSGTAVPNLLLGDLKRHKINMPNSLKAQLIIVQKLDALSLETKRLESIYQQKLIDLEELKKSILQKAFNGELNTADICV